MDNQDVMLLIDADEAARRLSLSKRYWLSLVATGKAPQGLLLGRRRLWTPEQLRAFVEGLGND